MVPVRRYQKGEITICGGHILLECFMEKLGQIQS